MDEAAVKMLIEDSANRDAETILVLWSIVGALKRQPGFNRQQFKFDLLRNSKRLERDGKKFAAALVRIAAGRSPNYPVASAQKETADGH
jgi:hypothetical protein